MTLADGVTISVYGEIIYRYQVWAFFLKYLSLAFRDLVFFKSFLKFQSQDLDSGAVTQLTVIV